MMIQRIGALSNNTNATKFKQQQYQTTPSFEGLGVNKSAQTMKALAAAAILGMASVGMSACKQPTDPTPIEIPEEKPQPPVEEEPVAEDPVEEKPQPPVKEEPISETPPVEETPEVEEVAPVEESFVPVAVEDTDNYKMIKAAGFKFNGNKDWTYEAYCDAIDYTLQSRPYLTSIYDNEEFKNNIRTGQVVSSSNGGSLIKGTGVNNRLFIEHTNMTFEAIDKYGDSMWTMSLSKYGDLVLTSGVLKPTDNLYISYNLISENGFDETKWKTTSSSVFIDLLNLTDGKAQSPIEEKNVPVNENPKYSEVPESVKSSEVFQMLGSWDTNVLPINVYDLFEHPEEMGEIQSGQLIGVMTTEGMVSPNDIDKIKIKAGRHYDLTLQDYYDNARNGYKEFLNKKITSITIGDKQYSNDDVLFMLAEVPENK